MDDIACKEHEELTPGCVTCQGREAMRYLRRLLDGGA